MKSPYRVRAVGLSSSAGTTLADIIAARRNEKGFFQKLPSFVGADFTPQLAAFQDPDLGHRLLERLTHLMCQAIDDLASQATPPTSYRIALCLPEIDAWEGSEALHSEDAAAWLSQVGKDRCVGWNWPDPTQVDVYTHGAPGFVSALMTDEKAGFPTDSQLLLLSVDSYACRHRLQVLSKNGVLFAKEQPWGFIPGEAGTAALLDQDMSASGVCILGLGLADEPDGELDERDSLASGLSQSLQDAAQTLPIPAVRLFNDCNNARYRASEFSYALHRLPSDTAVEDCELIQIPDVFGDVGAASLGVATCIAWTAQGRLPALACAGARINKFRAAIAFVS